MVKQGISFFFLCIFKMYRVVFYLHRNVVLVCVLDLHLSNSNKMVETQNKANLKLLCVYGIDFID